MSMTATRPRARPSVLLGLTPLLAGLIVLTALFWPECRAAVSVWFASTAYGHCFLVAPIAAYLAWDRRENLHGLTPEPTPALALFGLPLPLAWLAAERLGIMEGRQLVVIALLELLFLTTLGWRLFRALMGPLLYLVFLVPFGAFVTPLLQSFTANFIEVGLTILGIPHYISAMTIEISAGTFYVAEACAGLRFLIASIAFGVFFALLNYRSPGRRAAFIAASILIPIVANGVRALGIVVLGNILGSAEAAAADHIIYGWVFFSIVMLLLVAAGLPFRELPDSCPFLQRVDPSRPGQCSPSQSSPSQSSPAQFRSSQAWAILLVAAIAALGPATAIAFESRVQPAHLAARPTLVPLPGCSLTQDDPVTPLSDITRVTMACANHIWTITLQAVPARSTPFALNEARRQLTGSLDPDEIVVAPLPDTPGWQTIVSHDPPQVTAIAAWLDGTLAAGGLRQRTLQARHSMFGAGYQPLIMTITARSARKFTDSETRGMLTDLGRFVAAQPDLTAQIARLTTANVPANADR